MGRLLVATATPKHRVLLLTAYTVGLRLSEVAHFKIGDIDAERMTISVIFSRAVSEMRRPAAKAVSRMVRCLELAINFRK